MSEWQKFILTLAPLVLGSNALAVFVTLYFTRRRTAAETRSIDADALAKQAGAHKANADADRTDAETAQLYVAELRASIASWKSAMVEWGECVRQKAEAQAENEQLKRTVELLRQENVAKDKTITDLHGRLGDG